MEIGLKVHLKSPPRNSLCESQGKESILLDTSSTRVPCGTGNPTKSKEDALTKCSTGTVDGQRGTSHTKDTNKN